MAAKSDAIIKLVLVFVITILSFAVGTFVGKKYSDQQHKIAAYEPIQPLDARAVASTESNKASTMSDEEIARLAEEFVTDDTETGSEVAANAPAAEAPVAQDKVAANKPLPAEPLKATQAMLEGKKPVEEKVDKEPRLPAALPKNVAQYPTGKFTVQVASFSAENDAKKRAEELKSKGYSAFYIPAKVNGQTWYRVSVGQFPTEQEARTYRTEFMQKTKIESAIIQKIVH